MKRLGRLFALPFVWLWTGRREVASTVAFAVIAAGCWMAWPPLGLIVPGALALALLVFARITGKE